MTGLQARQAEHLSADHIETCIVDESTADTAPLPTPEVAARLRALLPDPGDAE